jgi:hypothetical protein
MACCLSLALPTVIALAMRSAGAAGPCAVTYTVQNQWTDGFSGNITIMNNGSATTSWQLTFHFTGGQTVTSGWSATWSQSGTAVTASSLSWNGTLGTGASTTIGFNGAWQGSNPVPTDFALNGTACNTSGTPPPTSQPPTSQPPTSPPPAGQAPQLHVSGNRLLTSSNQAYRMLGVNRSGGEFACVQGNGIWNGPMDQASVTAIRSWHVNTVRIPLNEDCWLALSNVQSQYAGANYQNAIKAYVSLLHQNGIVAVLDLHWTDGSYTGPSSACADTAATCQKPMPDAAHAVDFWRGVANAFKGDNATVLDLFNEPYPERATGSATSGWTCWRDGGTCAGIGYQVAGFQSLVNAVRGTGATNVILLGGLAYSNDETQWLQFKPTDSANNLVASWHSYNFNTCSNSSCWDSQIAPVAAQVPLLAGEFGENDCAHGYVDQLMSWMDSHNLSYLGWTWNNWDCSSGPSLISDYNGTATNYGVGLRNHLQSIN